MNASKGFTLLETLVAVAVLSLLGLGAALTLNSTLRSQQIIESATDQLDQLQRAQQLLRRDIEQTVVRSARTPQGDSRDAFLANGEPAPDNDGLVFDFYKSGRRILSPTQGTSHLEHVRYRLKGGQLIRESNSYLDAPSDGAWHSSTVMNDLNAVAVRFFFNRQWLSQWPPLNTSALTAVSAPLPSALRITLDTARYGAVTQTLLLPDAL